jgi:hypothetical protein
MSITYQAWRFFLLVVFLVMTGCAKQQPASTEPARPSNIPVTSVWVGGHDGGVFVLVEKSTQQGKDNYRGEIYYVSGDLAYKGPLKMVPEDMSDFDTTKKESYEGWDGNTLYISSNRRLQAME